MKLFTRSLTTFVYSVVLASGFFSQALLAQETLVELLSAGKTEAALDMISGLTDVNSAESDGTTALHWAVYYDNEVLVSQLIKRKADVRVKNDYGSTPLSQAAIIGNPAVIQSLLNAGADANEKIPMVRLLL